MLIYVPTTSPNLSNRAASPLGFGVVNCSSIKNGNGIISRVSIISKCSLSSTRVSLVAVAAAAVVVAVSSAAVAGGVEAPPEAETLSNIPQTLSGECVLPTDCKKPRIQKPKSRKAESCTIKCVTTCIRGGDGSPGEGPFNIRRPLIVFKEGFRSRKYCLVECSDICNLIGDGDDGP
ncbi:hypothetical protein L484_010449 [Morus notabilis]|uniref:Uncharacterized protein n=1 Tax=Morus notabilis TaxID=981085 RepID=W9QJD4_9ROSA|nr:uncharacterized protein LOC21393740 [Morus notabilis]EXB26132.1 hypothetical protein L484_010449 [Morus notabilis]